MDNYQNSNYILSGGGVILGLNITLIYQVLGIIVTAINLAILVYGIFCSIRARIKDGKKAKLDVNKAQDAALEMAKLYEEIKDLKNTIEKEQK